MTLPNNMVASEYEAPRNVRVDAAAAAKLRESLPKGSDSPGGMRRIACMSQLAKIFQPYVDLEKYLENPALIREREDFDVIFENSWSTRSYKFGETYLVTELEALYLVGVDNNRFERATGGTGFVYFNVPEDLLATYTYMKKTGKKPDKELQEQLDSYLKAAQELSDKRVLEFMKDKYNLLYMHRQNMATQGGKAGAPNDMEMLITFILNDEIQRANSKRQKLRAQWEQANRAIQGQE